MQINNNKTRKEFWKLMLTTLSAEDIENALLQLHPDTSRILQLHYLTKYSLTDIAPIMNRSISYVRHHHNKGIFQLQQYFTSSATASE